LGRVKSVSQKELDFAGRQENLKNKIHIKAAIPAGSIVILDDVFTSGATVECCTAALLKAGAGEISILTLAAS
jgi:predicted amidophosphoribosyltransferase